LVCTVNIGLPLRDCFGNQFGKILRCRFDELAGGFLCGTYYPPSWCVSTYHAGWVCISLRRTFLTAGNEEYAKKTTKTLAPLAIFAVKIRYNNRSIPKMNCALLVVAGARVVPAGVTQQARCRWLAPCFSCAFLLPLLITKQSSAFYQIGNYDPLADEAALFLRLSSRLAKGYPYTVGQRNKVW
jgi:hypothetical protein